MTEAGATGKRPVKRRQGPARGRILEAAARRFYADGVAATGIDTITAEAGVAKMSLYNNFDSKADLVTAYLGARHEEWLGLYRRRLADAETPRDAVLAVFDAYADHAGLAYEHGFRGCGLLNAAAELPTGHEGRAVVRRHKEEVEGLLVTHLRELLSDRAEKARDEKARHGESRDDGPRAGKALAEQVLDGEALDEKVRDAAEHLAFLLEGAIVRAGLEGDGTRMRRARAMAASLVDGL
ncbi:TetR/AcrR family transcriptional regulator [Streptomyces sp. NPDC002466]|uniref:TetR/AcrR family transcriptional regulator n=1 Tax=unclassified Streptomyces TaxID=2593676 RepID=UPI0011E7EB79|nr:TetR/AcrR family transcriptional regulator [Streptomyces sp. sk2.1]TXS65997.1 TetR/AcrR family transcriptional regulator [Streptomyces sp. sk2.1]